MQGLPAGNGEDGMSGVNGTGDCDLRIERKITFKNEPLRKAIYARWDDLASAVRDLDMSYGTVLACLTLRISPYYSKCHKIQGLKPWATKLVEQLGHSSSDLFPPELYTMAGHFVPRTDVILANAIEFVSLSEARHKMLDGETELVNAVVQSQCREAVKTELFHVSPREETVIRGHFGLDGSEKSLEELAQDFGITRERVRQIECKAMRKLRGSPVLRDQYRQLFGREPYGRVHVD